MDSTVVRTTPVRHRTRCAAPSAMSGTRARRCAAPDVPHRTGAPTADHPLHQVRPEAHDPLSSSATATFLHYIAGFGLRSGRAQVLQRCLP